MRLTTFPESNPWHVHDRERHERRAPRCPHSLGASFPMTRPITVYPGAQSGA